MKEQPEESVTPIVSSGDTYSTRTHSSPVHGDGDAGGEGTDAKLWLAAACLAGWLLFLFVGATVGGAVHLLLLAALWLMRP